MTTNGMVVPTVEAAFGSAPLDSAPTWTDVTDRLRGLSSNRHLGDEGTCTLVLDNRDRALEPEYAGSPYYPNVVPNLRMRVMATQGNLLDYDSSSAEHGFGKVLTTEPYPAGRSTEQALDGAYSFTVTGDGSGVDQVRVGDAADMATAVAVTPSTPYSLMAWVRAKTTGRTCRLAVDWYTAAGAFVTTAFGFSAADTTTGWTKLTLSGSSPGTAAFALMAIRFDAVAAGEVHFADQLGFFGGSVTTWSAGRGVVYDGFVDSITPSYTLGAGGGDAVVAVKCTDLTKFLARYPLRSPYAMEVKASAPVHWWPMGEAPGSTVMGDSGSQPSTGVYIPGLTLGHPAAVAASSATSLLIDVKTNPNSGTTGDPQIAGAAFPPMTGADASWEFVVGDYVPGGSFSVYFTNPAGGNAVVGFNIQSAGTPAQRQPVVSVYPDSGIVSGVGGFNYSASAASFDANQFHHFAVTKTSTTVRVYVNGVLLTTQTLGSATLTPSAFGVGYVVNDAGFTLPAAEISNVAVYARALTATEVAAHAAAARTPWQGDTTGSRVERLAAATGIPAGMRDIDSGVTTGLARQVDPTEGSYALEHVRLAETTEFGRAYTTAAGAWRFTDRRSLDGTTVAATFGDGGGSEIPYGGLTPEYDETTLIRTATVARQGGNPQTYTDPDATPEDAIFGETKQGLLYGTDGEAYDAAVYLVTQNNTPHVRFPQITLQGERSPTVMAQVATRDIGDKVTVRLRPPGGGTPVEKTVVIEGVSHNVDIPGRTWRAAYDLGPVDAVAYWALENATRGQLNTTTVLAF